MVKYLHVPTLRKYSNHYTFLKVGVNTYCLKGKAKYSKYSLLLHKSSKEQDTHALAFHIILLGEKKI